MTAAALAAATYVAFREDGVSPALPEVGIGHVHGLRVNPRDGGVILATHSGLWRTPAGAVRPSRRRRQPPGHDGVHRRRPRSFQGQVVYSLDGVSGMVFASEDRGRTWTRHEPPSPLVDLVIDPDDSSHLVASGGSGIFESNDRGRTWSPVAPRTAGFLAWPSSDRLFLLDGAGHLSVATDRAAGRSWRTVGSVGDEPEAFLAAGGKLYVALHHGVVKESADGGVSWSVRSRS